MMRKSSNDGRDKKKTAKAGSTNKTTHYDRDRRKTGETLEKTDGFGLKTIEYYDRDGRKTGESRETTGGFGFKRIEHFDRDGRKTGETRVKIND
ncbi:MAG: hypothetical protein PVH61_04925 [Candidatus Aminicenantes bacterium]